MEFFTSNLVLTLLNKIRSQREEIGILLRLHALLSYKQMFHCIFWGMQCSPLVIWLTLCPLLLFKIRYHTLSFLGGLPSSLFHHVSWGAHALSIYSFQEKTNSLPVLLHVSFSAIQGYKRYIDASHLTLLFFLRSSLPYILFCWTN